MSDYTIRRFIKDLESLSDGIKDLPVTVECPNGIRVQPKIKFRREQEHNFKSKILEVVIHYE
jgi:phosphoserine phosphatase